MIMSTGAEVARLVFAQRLRVHAPPGVRRRILRLERGGDARQIAARLLDRDARFEPAHHLPRVIAAVVQRIRLHRRPRARRTRELESRRHHADDRVPHAVDHDRFANGARPRVEPVAPHAVAEDDRLR